MNYRAADTRHMARALQLAQRGEGHVEPNPQVGCVIARGDDVLGEGWHRRFGGPHAEIEALQSAATSVTGATIYVTLEPCCHAGKTPPCTDAILQAGLARVVVAQSDPFEQVSGAGLSQLREAGLEVEVGLLADRARSLNAPYLKLVRTGRPWVIAKWAQTLDGRLATSSGDSQWISGPASRAVVHRLRGCVDAIMVGRGTALHDDPLLTARPPGPRTATRIVLDSQAVLPSESQLVRTAREVPLLVVSSVSAPRDDQQRLRAAGCEVWLGQEPDLTSRAGELLEELGRRRMTRVLVEGGQQLLGSLLELGHIDEVHVFIAPKIVGGTTAPGPIGGTGIARLTDAARLTDRRVALLGEDLYITGRLARPGRD